MSAERGMSSDIGKLQFHTIKLNADGHPRAAVLVQDQLGPKIPDDRVHEHLHVLLGGFAAEFRSKNEDAGASVLGRKFLCEYQPNKFLG
ncbi:hypothetical protein A5707_16415 [Mycobacterium kyorinense]|uniref:Uncharacterized protein n=1 Tax=Mycobacterium kyorinense TaxID=487514 RepID=A0A1A2ZJZ2_9MYCO|nr:hypothetical protein A5707_16415 [Mycobacterium kyorinense]